MSEPGVHPRGGGCQAVAPPPPNLNLKNSDFIDTVISNFYVIDPSAESATKISW